MPYARLVIGVLAIASIFTACSSTTSMSLAPGCQGRAAQGEHACDDDSALSAVAGVCQRDGGCSCSPGFALNPSTGRCKLVPAGDAGLLICKVGNDRTCNDNPSFEALEGACVPGGVCRCNSDFVINPVTGHCKPRPILEPDAAGPASDDGPPACDGSSDADDGPT